MQASGWIFDIQRFCTHDGPGIRTVVFLQGCPLRCSWCHNPEGWTPRGQVAIYPSKCIGCGRCADVCRNDAVADRGRCVSCGACCEACPSESRRLIGRIATADEVIATAMRDQPFYVTSGGGVTLSGGEPLSQPEFSCGLLRQLKERGAHTAVETSGFTDWETLVRISPLTDLFLYDIKLLDSSRHAELCGVGNEQILANARRLSQSGAHIVFRTPVVPGVNDGAEEMRRIGEFVASLPGLHQHELLPYHGIGAGKYAALGLEVPLLGDECGNE